MKLLLDAEGKMVVRNNRPVYIADDGKEIEFDAPATIATITRLNAEAKAHRERAEAVEGKLKTFEGIDDAAAARKALDTVRNLDSKKLVDAGEVEKVREEAMKALKAQYEPVMAERDQLKNDLYAEKIGGSFSRSKSIAEKFVIPADLVQARFGNAFTIEDGKIVAKDTFGNKIFSRSRPGEVADFDEALEVLVDQYPYKDQILKGTGASGSGTAASNATAGGKKVMTRAQFDALDPLSKISAAKEATIAD